MCGVCGIWHYGSGLPVTADQLELMKKQLERRGPDDQGTHLDGDLGLGFRRLAIIDLSGGRQPMVNARGDLWLVFNGEIYNHKTLRGELKARGCEFRTRSDTEVLLYAYQEFGEDCLQKLRGMFAFVVWDRRQQQLFVARDRFGIKPFFYFDDGKRFVFASELKALRPGVPCTPCLNEALLEYYLTYRYVPGPETFWRGVHKLQPGHYLVRTRDSSTVQRYWTPRFCDGRGHESVEALAEKTRHELLESVKLHLDADVPVGVLLSGGLDSSTILATAKQSEPHALKAAFSVGFKERGAMDETAYAAEAARHFGIEHRVLRIDARDFADGLEDFIWWQDEPLADATGLPLFLLCRYAKETVTVLLSGEGADEIFAGYDRYKPSVLMCHASAPPLAPLRGLARALARNLPSGTHASRLAGALAAADIVEQWNSLASMTSPALRRELLVPQMDVERLHCRLMERLWAGLDGIRHPLNQLQALDMQMWLPENMLTKKDRMTMAASIEARVPFLDHKLAEFGLQLPPAVRLRGLTGKWILRQAMKGFLPSTNVRRRKTGWPIPLDEWFRGDLRTLSGDVLLGKACRERGLFRAKSVQRVLEDHWQQRAQHGKLLFMLVCAELWFQAYT